jgi:ElaB/YqjD/DUF883 family membrane-anchored ribosome-binding protein
MKNPIASEVAALEAGRARLAQDISAVANQAAGLLKGAGGDAVDRTGAYVNDHPWRALGLAAVAGVLAGVLLARR